MVDAAVVAACPATWPGEGAATVTGGGVALVVALALLVPWCTVRGVLASMSGAWEVGVGRCLVLLLPVVVAGGAVGWSAGDGVAALAAVAAGDVLVAAVGAVSDRMGWADRMEGLAVADRVAREVADLEAVAAEVARLEAMWRAE